MKGVKTIAALVGLIYGLSHLSRMNYSGVNARVS
jgi:hypothetical protein